MAISKIENNSLASGVPSTAKLPAGTVLQVVQGSTTTSVDSSSSSYADTGLTASITPTSATSKILVLVNHSENTKTSGNSANALGLQLQRTGLAETFTYDCGFTGTAISNYFSASYVYLDSPATTSTLTYKTQFRNTEGNNSFVRVQANSMRSTITLMEIAA